MDLPKLAKGMKEKKVIQKRRKYDVAFREEVVRMVFSGRPVNEVAQSLGIGENLIYRWKSRYEAKEESQPSLEGKVIRATEVEALNKRVRELEIERDILKKALAIFSRGI